MDELSKNWRANCRSGKKSEIQAMQRLNEIFACLLKDLMSFLEVLADADLSEDQQAKRSRLLERSRAAIECSVEIIEPYLDMSGCGVSDNGVISQANDEQVDYINVDSSDHLPRNSLQHYYETFHDNKRESRQCKIETNGKIDQPAKQKQQNEEVVKRWSHYSAAEAKLKARKTSELVHLTRGNSKLLFSPLNTFWIHKQHCWVNLIDSHLLIYTSEKDNQPYLVREMLGYKCRLTPNNTLTRDRRYKDTTFEIYRPGERTLRFAANDVQETRDWVNALNDCCAGKTMRTNTLIEMLGLDCDERSCIERAKKEGEKYQDASSVTKPKPRDKRSPDSKTEEPTEAVVTVEASPTPETTTTTTTRLRRLPSLPPGEHQRVKVAKHKQELYDDEELYHRIDESVKAESRDHETYDDLIGDESALSTTETYDDVQAMRIANKSKTDKEKSRKIRAFLERVSKRKLSFKRDEKKNDDRAGPDCISAGYNQITSLWSGRSAKINEQQYKTPLPPRPIYSCLPPVPKRVDTGRCNGDNGEYGADDRDGTADDDEFYDDIGIAAVERRSNGSCRVDNLGYQYCNEKLPPNVQLSIESEHYQVPKPIDRDQQRGRDHELDQNNVEQPDELYSDVKLAQSVKSH